MKKYKIGVIIDHIDCLNKENLEILVLGCLECETLYANIDEIFYEEVSKVLANIKKISNINSIEDYDKIYRRK